MAVSAGGIRVLRRSGPRLGAARQDARAARDAPRQPVVRRSPRGVPVGHARVGGVGVDRLPSGAPWPARQSHGAVRGRQDRRARRRRAGFPHAHAPRHRRHAAGAVAGRARRRARAASSPSPTSRRAPPISSIPSISATSITARARYAPGGKEHRARCRRQPRCGRRLGDDPALLPRSAVRSQAGGGVPVALRSRPHVARRAARFARACRRAARRRALRGRGPAHRRAAARRGRGDPAADRLRSRPGDDRRRRRSRGLAGRAWPVEAAGGRRRGGGRAGHGGVALRHGARTRRRCWASSTRCAGAVGGRRRRRRRPGRPRLRGARAASSRRSTWRGRTEANRLRRSRPALGGCRGGQAGAHRQRPTWRLGTGRDAAVPDGNDGGARRERRRGRPASSTSRPPLRSFLGTFHEGFDGSPRHGASLACRDRRRHDAAIPAGKNT